MKLCRFLTSLQTPAVGILADDATIIDLSPARITSLSELLESNDLPARMRELTDENLPRLALADVQLLAPVDRQEIWAAGVTYLRSRKARMEESEFSATAYDKVYEAPRPELFFKSVPEKVAGPGDFVGIRADATWSVPEPELALVFNSRGHLAGFTIGNDMSSRDIEGENLLYLPQAKIYEGSCALGPFITIGTSEAEARAWEIEISIERGGAPTFSGKTQVGQIKRSFGELADYLFRSQKFPRGVVLLTGTGIVPPDGFTLWAGDKVSISISGVGTLENSVAVV